MCLRLPSRRKVKRKQQRCHDQTIQENIIVKIDISIDSYCKYQCDRTILHKCPSFLRHWKIKSKKKILTRSWNKRKTTVIKNHFSDSFKKSFFYLLSLLYLIHSLKSKIPTLKIACSVRRWRSVKTKRGFLGAEAGDTCSWSKPSFLLHCAEKGIKRKNFCFSKI